jgi:hypothetical protein
MILQQVANMKKLRMRRFFEAYDALVKANMSDAEINAAADRALKGALKREQIQGYEATDTQAEVAKVQQMLPQLGEEGAIQIVDSLMRLSQMANGDKVWGLFQNGVIYIANDSSRGTAYHEAFHYVSQTLLSEAELTSLYEYASSVFGNMNTIALEERLAEGFRQYMQGFEDISKLKGLAKIWGKLKMFVKTLFGKEAQLNRLYRDIRKGRFANRKAQESKPSTLHRDISDSALYEAAIQQDIDDLNWEIERAEQRRLAANNAIAREWTAFTKDPRVNVRTVGPKGRRMKMYFYTRDSFAFIDDAKKAIPSQYKNILRVIESRGRYILVSDVQTKINAQNRNNAIINLEIKELQRELRYLESDVQDRNYYKRALDQYYNEKYDRLSEEDENYLEERGISKSTFDNWTELEKDTFLKCRN